MTCATIADAIATMAAGTDDCASEEEEEGGRQPPVGVGTTSRYSFFGGSDNIHHDVGRI